MLNTADIASDSLIPASYWRSLSYFNGYRSFIALILLILTLSLGVDLPFGHIQPRLFIYLCLAYLLLSGIFAFFIHSRLIAFAWQLSIHILTDIVFLVGLIVISGGLSSGLGLLLLASLAAGGLIGQGRLALFYAAVASIGILLGHTYLIWYSDAQIGGYVQAGLLSIGYFATAWLAHSLTQRAIASEKLARKRGIDFANLAEANQLVIQDLDDGVLVMDQNGIVIQANPRAQEWLGTLAKPTSLKQYSIILSDRWQGWRENRFLFDTLNEPVRLHRDKLLEPRFVAVGTPERSGTVIFLEDLSRVQTQAQQLKLAALGRLTASIAHEIRNPLSAINHATELLLEELPDDATSQRLLQIVHDNTKRMERMVQEVLKLNRRDRAIRERFQLGEYLHTFIDEFSQIEKISVDFFKLEITHDINILFDRSHLNQVMWNLCRNALRYCQRLPGSIHIRVSSGSQPPYPFSIAVRDDGPGVSEKFIPQLFEPFATSDANGVGLGLYIAQELTEANGAILSYKSVEHSGAIFVIDARST